MELRQLTTDHERQIFAECLSKARATAGYGFRETARSRLGRAHLTFGNVYAIFENEGDPSERMAGGFIVHDLATLPQSFAQPDLSYLPPKSVIEGSELWALTRGAAGVAKRIAPAIAGLLQAKAVVLYPFIKPFDLTAPHAQLGFVNACDPIQYHFCETLEGEDLWVQPMVLQGEKLDEYIRRGFDYLLGGQRDRHVLRFDASLATTRPAAIEPAVAEREVAKSSVVSSHGAGDERNGAASM